jgi:hypothetical protein
MSDDSAGEEAGDELGRRLLASVRRERPSEALRERVLLLGRAERTPVRVGALRSRRPARRLGRALGWSAGLACAAGVCALVWGAAQRRDPVAISAERSGSPAPAAPRDTAPAQSPPRPEAPTPAVRVPEPPRAQPSAREVAGKKPAELTPRAAISATPQPGPGAAAAQPEPSLSATATLAEQLAQLKAARSRLRAGDAAGALRLLDEYQTDPRGTALAAEASLLRIEALAASGQRAEAASEARRFATDYPTSPLIDRARSFVVGDDARGSDVAP